VIPESIYLTTEVRRGLAGLPEGSASCVVTSPPYWGRRRYTGAEDEVGIGDFDAYLADLLVVFDAAARVLHPEGLLWLNIGDTAAGSGGSGGDYRPGGCYADRPRYRQGRPPVSRGQWASVPHRLAHALQDAGWLLRSEIIWDKGVRRPESLDHVRRPGESHETIFMFARSKCYRFDAGQLREQGSVWRVTPDRSASGHQAPMPLELAERCVRPSTAPGFVLDPFAGSGTTLLAARRAGRFSVGLDFDPSAARIAQRRFGPGLLCTAG
jgi:site-specific DNA-methyltransferase (cytosine-N4-specific)